MNERNTADTKLEVKEGPGERERKIAKYFTKQNVHSRTCLQDNQTISDEATVLNNYFAQCFNSVVPPLDERSFEQYQLHPLCCPNEFLCSEEEVKELLLSLNTSKANGPDGISPLTLKSTAYSIAPGLTKLFSKSVSSGRFPRPWKLSSVAPVPKGDDDQVCPTIDPSLYFLL